MEYKVTFKRIGNKQINVAVEVYELTDPLDPQSVKIRPTSEDRSLDVNVSAQLRNELQTGQGPIADKVIHKLAARAQVRRDQELTLDSVTTAVDPVKLQTEISKIT